MNDDTKQAAMVGIGGVAAGLGLLAVTGTSAAEAAEQLPVEVPQQAVDTVDSWVPAYEGAEWGISGNGVFYDDPETGPHNDEPGDDTNTSFETIEDAIGLDSEEHAENYAPDTQDGSTAPSSGVIADPGDSQNWGDAPEQENDDLTERAADSNLSDDEKSAFDRVANYDDPASVDTSGDYDDDGGSSSSGGSSGGSSDSGGDTIEGGYTLPDDI